MKAQKTPRSDIHQAVTDQIIAMMEKADASGFKMPWHRPGISISRPTNALSKARYNGINVLSLWASADSRNFSTGLWATYKQWQELGAQVRKGESASPIVFYKPLTIEDEKAEATPETEAGTRTIRIVKGYWGFNADQVDGFALPEAPTNTLVQRLDHAERFFQNIGVPISHGGTRAYYRPSEDRIQMPELTLFRDTDTSTVTEGYYGVLGHEAGHATGASKRLDRDLSGRFGDERYAMEELIAELTAANLYADLQITAQPREDHAHYLKNWLQVLKSDKTAIFTAAAQAHKAAEFLHSLQPDHSARQHAAA